MTVLGDTQESPALLKGASMPSSHSGFTTPASTVVLRTVLDELTGQRRRPREVKWQKHRRPAAEESGFLTPTPSSLS